MPAALFDLDRVNIGDFLCSMSSSAFPFRSSIFRISDVQVLSMGTSALISSSSSKGGGSDFLGKSWGC